MLTRALLTTALLLCAGCSGEVSIQPNPMPVAVSGKLTGAGATLDEVTLNFQPTGGGLPAVAPVKAGAFEVEITPGKYTYFLTPAANSKKELAIPESMKAGSLDRQIEINGPTTLDLAVN